jgi:hypothetical protein
MARLPGETPLQVRGGQNDRKARDEQSEGDGREATREIERVGQHIDHLQRDPGAGRVQARHLPEGAAPHSLDQSIDGSHMSVCPGRKILQDGTNAAEESNPRRRIEDRHEGNAAFKLKAISVRGT